MHSEKNWKNGCTTYSHEAWFCYYKIENTQKETENCLRLITVLHPPVSSYCVHQNTTDFLFSLNKFMNKFNKPDLFFFYFFRGGPHGKWDLAWPGIKPESPALTERSPNHWTTREVWFCKCQFYLFYIILGLGTTYRLHKCCCFKKKKKFENHCSKALIKLWYSRLMGPLGAEMVIKS